MSNNFIAINMMGIYLIPNSTLISLYMSSYLVCTKFLSCGFSTPILSGENGENPERLNPKTWMINGHVQQPVDRTSPSTKLTLKTTQEPPKTTEQSSYECPETEVTRAGPARVSTRSSVCALQLSF